MIFLYIALALAAAVIAGALVCFFMAFYQAPKPPLKQDEFALPDGEIYKAYEKQMTDWMRQVRALPGREMETVSFDGLKLCGRFYEFAPGAPVEIMLHGYRGSAERDLCGGVQRAFSLGHSALVVDQRSSGKSGGRVISFGINESRDCESWVALMRKELGEDVKIMLTGISMGAASVLIAAGRPLPENVVGVLADCGYTSARDIIKKVIGDMKLPPALYPLLRLAARLFGRFDPDETSPLKAMSTCRLPVIFMHGEADDFVPCEMSRQLYAACSSEKKLVTFPGAGHGLSYLADKEKYLAQLEDFCKKVGF